jgi:hypothetical protein
MMINVPKDDPQKVQQWYFSLQQKRLQKETEKEQRNHQCT